MGEIAVDRLGVGVLSSYHDVTHQGDLGTSAPSWGNSSPEACTAWVAPSSLKPGSLDSPQLAAASPCLTKNISMNKSANSAIGDQVFAALGTQYTQE